MACAQKLERLDVTCLLLLCSFKLPGHLRLANVEGLVTETAEVHSHEPGSGVAQTFASQIDPSLTWAFVAWLRTVCSLPIFIKARSSELRGKWNH